MAGLWPKGRSQSIARWLLASIAALLWLYRVDGLVFGLLTRERPLLYDQIFMLHHATVLVMDLWTWWAPIALLLQPAGRSFASSSSTPATRRRWCASWPPRDTRCSGTERSPTDVPAR